MQQKKVLACLFLISFLLSGVWAQTDSHHVVLPLPATGEVVTRPLAKNLVLEIAPESDGWDVSVTALTDEKGLNLLYHNTEWYGAYPTQIDAWQVAKKYFPDTRWLCVRDHPIEIKIQIKNTKIKKLGDDEFEFTQGQLIVSWFYRPCTRGWQ